MQLYSDLRGRRAAQIAGDVVAVAVLATGIVAAVAIHDAIAAFVPIGADVSRSGDGLSATMTDIGGRLAGVPLIGGGISGPFTAASDAAGNLAQAGIRWQRGVEGLAMLAGWTVAALVMLLVLAGWVRPRLAGSLRRTAVARLAATPASRDLLALRALVAQSPGDVARIDQEAAAAWRRGDADVIAALAALELRAAGVVRRAPNP